MQHKICIIEDDMPIAEMYQYKLKLSGYDTRIAHNGQEGLQLCQDYLPDLILLDLRMPVMNGDEMLAKLRTQAWGANIRVIILTNISRSEAPSGLRFLSVDRYIVKAHTTPSQVVQTIQEVLR